MKKTPKTDVWYILSLCGQLGFIIAIPVAGLAYLGAMLDRKLYTSPLFILIGISLAMMVSGFTIWRMVKKIEHTD